TAVNGGVRPGCADEDGERGALGGYGCQNNPDKSTLTVRKGDGGIEMTIVYDSSTKWVAQYHAAKTVTDIDATQVKEGDRVICKGTWESKGVFKATVISKRLSHPA